MLSCGILNISIERIAYRPLRHAPRLAPLITAVGVSFFLEGVLFLWKGPTNVHCANITPNAGFEIIGATIGAKDLLVIGVSIVLVIGLALFVDRTRLGKAMRATAQDRDAALLMGIDIDRTIAATFFIGAILPDAGGAGYGPNYNISVLQLAFDA